MHPLLLLFCLSVMCFSGSAQKALTAVKAAQPPVIDGNLDDAAWKTAPVASDFTQYYPDFGTPATHRSLVTITYDDDAIYIGAYLYDDPTHIRTQLTARDGEQRQDVDYFAVFFDTYNDHQNGFQFLVTSANVQSDSKLTGSSNDPFSGYGDRSWDAVWESKTSLKSDGWVAELRIPYISLRFSKKDVQTWGLQLLRFSRRNNESAFWNLVDPKVNGFVNQFGKFEHLQDIHPPLRLSFSPYISGGVRSNPTINGYQTEWLRSGGMDVKYGINESFTLDATLIPDFGQVVSDNVINNLTPYEVQFAERRPFFTEGTELFNKADLFYSRRVGAIPAGYYAVNQLLSDDPDLSLVKNPAITRLYNGIKFSGRTKKKLGIGIFNAVTAPMHATLRNTRNKQDTIIQTEPLTNYNIIVLDQAFKGQSYLTLTNTSVLRKGGYRNANVSAVDFAVYDKKNVYGITGDFRYSRISGYNQYDGYKAVIDVSKVSGKVQYSAGMDVESDLYDPNDLGYLQAPNEVAYRGNISYNQFTPTRNFISYNYNLNVAYNWLYKPYHFTSMEVTADGAWVFKNFWDIYTNVGIQPFWQNDFFELQTPGRFVRKPAYLYAFFGGSSDSRKRLFLNYQFGLAEGGTFEENAYFRFNTGLRYRFSNRFTLSLHAERQHDKLQIGYAFEREANGDPILGFRDVKDFSTILSGNYNFTPRMNLTLRGRHYWNRVEYLSFYNVREDGTYRGRAFIPGKDQNFNAFNVDAFYTWDFKPGSRIVAGWKNWLGDSYLLSLPSSRFQYYSRNLGHTFTLPHGNEFTVKVIYFLDYNQLRGRH